MYHINLENAIRQAYKYRIAIEGFLMQVPGDKMKDGIIVPWLPLELSLSTKNDIISYMVTRHNWKNGAEIGIGDGTTCNYLLEQNKKLSMIGVDVWETDDITYQHDDIEQRARDFAQKWGDRLYLMKVSSISAADLVVDYMLDFVIIDGNPVYSDVVNDIVRWKKKIKHSGFIFGTNANNPDVRKAVVQHCPYYIILNDNMWLQRIVR